MSYYKDELDKVKMISSAGCMPTIKLYSEDGQTKWLSLNDESIPEIIDYLNRLQEVIKLLKPLQE